MGSIQLTWKKPQTVFEIIKRLNSATKKNYYANYILHFEPKSIDKAIEAGSQNFQFSFGIPNREIVVKLKDAGCKFGVQVSSKMNAEKVLELNPDFLICQGLEAGGHLQATQYNKDLFPLMLSMADSVPVLLAGGISTGEDIRTAIHDGAAGVVMGTRLIATKESTISDVYGQMLVNADKNSTVYTNCFNKGWDAMHRVLRNSTFLKWESEGSPLPGKKPGEDDIIAKGPSGYDIKRYEGHDPFTGVTGDLEAMCMYAGEGVEKIKDIPTASDLIERLWREYKNE